MPTSFNFAVSPFDCLSESERQLVRDSVDIAYFREGAAVLEPGVVPTHLFVVIKGYVQQFEGDESVGTYGPDDSFDGRSLVAGKVSSRFVAKEEVLAYQLARQAVSDLISGNATFGALLFADLSRKLSALSERQSQHELQSLTMARVGQAPLQPAEFVDGETDIVSIARLFQHNRTKHVLVRDDAADPPRIGIFTTSGLHRAILHGTPLHELAVREIATFPLVEVRPNDYLFDALAAMIRHQVSRLVVVDGDRYVGVLENLDLLSFLSNHSYLITLQIAKAGSVAELKVAADQINHLIGLLHNGGTKVSLIANLVQALNAQLFERTWRLIAAPDLVANSCLFVMGSEGRGEQLLKTDQDNGLVLRDGYAAPGDLAEVCNRLSEALAGFGYPECPGGIMVSNTQWRHSANEFGQTVRRWLLMPTPDSLMALAIFLDAHAVCGDASLLEQVRGEVFKLVNDNQALLARFASAINSFESGSGWWTRIFAIGDPGRDQIDLKKLGTFPLVHGVRALALEARIAETSTVGRIEALVAANKLPRDLAGELVDSLQFFMRLKLQVGLDSLATGRGSGGNGVDTGRLSVLDRDLLKDTMGVVKRFKLLMRQRFFLDSM
jgi:CBS domain-containing protein